MKSSKYLVLTTLLIAGESIFLLPFVIARIFRPTFLAVFEINNLQLGSAFSVYGILAMASYFLGGPIADRFSPKKLMAFSLLATAIGGVIMTSIPSIFTLTLLYGFWGITTILLFWAAFIKATRAYGGKKTQGFAFGLIDAGRGLFAAILASIAVFAFDYFLPTNAVAASKEDLSSALSSIILIFSCITAATSVLVWLFIPKTSKEQQLESEKISLEGIKNVIKRKAVWLNSIIILCAYVAYKCTDDFSLFASDVLGYNDVDAAHIGTISFWLRPVGALAAGYLGDRLRHSKMIYICFLIIILGSLIIGFSSLSSITGTFIILTIAITSLGIYGLRGLYFALLEENKIPLIYTGSAVGFISFIGYTPDVFFGPLMGYVLDSSPGAEGHYHLFLILAIFSTIGLITALALQKINKN